LASEGVAIDSKNGNGSDGRVLGGAVGRASPELSDVVGQARVAVIEPRSVRIVAGDEGRLGGHLAHIGASRPVTIAGEGQETQPDGDKATA